MPTLLAIDNNALLDSIRDATSSGPDLLHLALVIGGGALLLLLLFLLARFYTREIGSTADPRVRTFKQSLAILGLFGDDRRALFRIAELSKAPVPAAILLSPQNLARSLAAAEANSPDESLHRRIEALCQKLYKVPLPQEEPNTTRADAGSR